MRSARPGPKPGASPAVRLRSIGVAVLALAALVLTVADQATAQTGSADSTRIAAASRAFSDAYVRGDTATIRDLYTEDAVLLPPGREITGRDQIVRYFAPGPRRTNVSHSMESSDLRVSGEMAIDVGMWHNTWRVDDGEEQSASERYLVIWRRGSDGRWRIEYDMWHRPSR